MADVSIQLEIKMLSVIIDSIEEGSRHEWDHDDSYNWSSILSVAYKLRQRMYGRLG